MKTQQTAEAVQQDRAKADLDEAPDVVALCVKVALAPIMTINGKATIFGDGASALVNNSGKAEYIRTGVVGADWGPGYNTIVSAERKHQTEEVVL